MRTLQDIVKSHKIDIKQLFSHWDKDKGGTLDKTEFFKMLKVIDKNITKSDTDDIFDEIDFNGDGDLQFEEFAQIFNNYDFCDLDNFSAHLIEGFREIILANKLNTKDIFVEIDKNKVGFLSQPEFTEYVRKIAPAFKQYEINQIYDEIDANKDGTISF